MMTMAKRMLSSTPSMAMKPGRESTVSSTQLFRSRIAAPTPAMITSANRIAVDVCIASVLPAWHASGVSA